MVINHLLTGMVLQVPGFRITQVLNGEGGWSVKPRRCVVVFFCAACKQRRVPTETTER